MSKIPKIISILFNVFDILADFIISFLYGTKSKFLIFGSVLSINTSIRIAWAFFISFAFTLVLSAYRFIMNGLDFLSSVSTKHVSSSDPQALPLAMDILKASGIFQAFYDVIVLILPLISPLFMLWLNKLLLSYLYSKRKSLLSVNQTMSSNSSKHKRRGRFKKK